MSTSHRTARRLRRTAQRCAAGAGILALGLGLAACGSDAAASGEDLELYGHTITQDDALAERVPEEWKAGITVPVKVLQPNAFVDDDGETVGLQPDFVRALGAKWGVPVTMEPVAFDGHVPGVMAGKYAFTASTGDHEQRRDVMDMVDYINAGVAWLTTQDSDIQTKDDICGHTIGSIKGTDQELRAEDVVAECEAKGISGTESVGFSNTLITVPLEADRIDVAYDSVSYMLYAASHQSDQFRLVGEQELLAPIAFGVKKGEQEKVDLLRDSMQSLMDDGVYEDVMAEWGQEDLSLDQVYVNQEGMPTS
ncbi:transporter substrate-binding domain-containing protein [Citricoccus sp. NPDC055426]|uniref:transporter substrate-binding domain-containing protein n=1 Tax=Citricoccus sp. NPDC055426 TaxID=3155536 RepID=UPI0034328B56